MKVFLNFGHLGEDVECDVQYDYILKQVSSDYYQPDDPENIEVRKLTVIPWGVSIDPKFLTESAVDSIEDQISEYERR